MGDKEKNLANTVGVLPTEDADPIPVGKIPDGGTQIAKSGVATGDTTLIHTVNGGDTLYLSFAHLHSHSTAMATAQLIVTDGDDTTQYTLVDHGLAANHEADSTFPLLPPLEIPSGYKIKAVSDNAGCDAHAFIHGYEA